MQTQTILYLEPHDYQVNFVNIDFNMEFLGLFHICLSCERSPVARIEERWLVYLQASL